MEEDNGSRKMKKKYIEEEENEASEDKGSMKA